VRIEGVAAEIGLFVGQWQVEAEHRHRPFEVALHAQRRHGRFVRRAARGVLALDLEAAETPLVQ